MALKKHQDQKQFEEEAVYLTYVFRIIVHDSGTPRQELASFGELEAGVDVEATEKCCLMTWYS